MKIAIIGCGGLGSSLARGLLGSNTAELSLSLCDRSRTKMDLLQKEFSGRSISATVSAREAVSGADVVLLAVKPKDVDDVLQEMAAGLALTTLLVSCASGVTIESLEVSVGDDKVIARAMPNTAVAFSLGTTGLFLGPKCDPKRDQARLENIFSALGEVRVVGAEEDLHAVTALSGSGPAFVLLMLEAMIDAGVRQGLSHSDAHFFAKGAVKSAAALVAHSPMSPNELRAQITSPAGTTAEGLYTLEQGGFRGDIMNAIEAAALRSQELSEIELFDSVG